MAAGAARDVPRRSSGVDTSDVVSPLLTGLPGLLFTGEAGLALRSLTLLAVSMSEGREASPDRLQEHTLVEACGPN